MLKRLRVVVMVSGGGTNLQAIIDKVKSGEVTNTDIVGVISNKYNVKSLERASENGIDSKVVCKADFKDREDFEKALLNGVDSFNPDLVVLAGFLVKIPDEMTLKYSGRIINIHPSLIPSFCGMGYYGLKVHEKALERGVKVSGATVHFVNSGMDEGPIIAQKAVCVDDDDTPETLQLKIMKNAEWVILPQAIDDIANDRIELVDGKVRRKS